MWRNKIRNLNIWKIAFLLFWMFGCNLLIVKAQDIRPEIQHYQYFENYQKDMNAFFKNKDTGKGSGYKQWKRQEYLLSNRLGDEGQLVKAPQYYRAAIKQQKQLNRSSDGEWEFMGPTSVSQDGDCSGGGMGRINCMTIHPTDDKIIWVGAAAGGLWKTTVGGNDWTCLTNGLPTLGVSAIVVNPSNTNEIFIMTGDGDGADTPSLGILKTNDGGVNWEPTSFDFSAAACSQFSRGYDLKMSPSDKNIMIAATTCGLYQSTDRGVSWSFRNTGTFFDIEFHPTDEDIVYASSGQFIFKSSNAGNSFSIINDNTLPFGAGNVANRIELAVTDDNPQKLVAMYGALAGNGNNSGLFGIFSSDDEGNNGSWTALANSPNMLGPNTDGTGQNSQSWYDLAFAIDDTDEKDMILGGVIMWRSVSGGGQNQWTVSSNWFDCGTVEFAHADIHEIVYRDGLAYACTDGGLYVSNDDGVNWTDLSDGLEITQFYSIAGTPQNPVLYVGGTQDNGINVMIGSSLSHQVTGDGTSAMINYENQFDRWCSTQNSNLWRNTSGVSWNINKPPGAGAFLTPYIMDDDDPSVIFGGTDRLWRRTQFGNNFLWINLNAVDDDNYVAMAQSKLNGEILYMITRNNVYKVTNALSSNGNTMVENVTNNLASLTNQPLTDIAVSKGSSNRIYVTVGGFVDGEKVFRSINGGDTWLNMSQGLPNVPVNCAETASGSVHPLYIGTDVGVYYRGIFDSEWIPFRNNMPAVVVNSLYINTSNDKISAGTFGRGIWRTDLRSTCLNTITLEDNEEFNTGFYSYNASNKIISAKNYIGGIGTDVSYRAFQSIELTDGFTISPGSIFEANIGDCEN